MWKKPTVWQTTNLCINHSKKKRKNYMVGYLLQLLWISILYIFVLVRLWTLILLKLYLMQTMIYEISFFFNIIVRLSSSTQHWPFFNTMAQIQTSASWNGRRQLKSQSTKSNFATRKIQHHILTCLSSECWALQCIIWILWCHTSNNLIQYFMYYKVMTKGISLSLPCELLSSQVLLFLSDIIYTKLELRKKYLWVIDQLSNI